MVDLLLEHVHAGCEGDDGVVGPFFAQPFGRVGGEFFEGFERVVGKI